MNKIELLQVIVLEMEKSLIIAQRSTQRAIESATDEETVPEHKYDTLALEASYLAHGQAMRAEECERELSQMKQLSIPTNMEHVALGCLVCLLDDSDECQWFFIAPCAGGLKVDYQQQRVMVVTLASPLGKALKGKSIGDDVDYQVGQTNFSYQIDTII